MLEFFGCLFILVCVIFVGLLLMGWYYEKKELSGISEPVITFVDTFRKSNFKCKDGWIGYYTSKESYTWLDKTNNCEYLVHFKREGSFQTGYNFVGIDKIEYYVDDLPYNLDWLTQEELQYIFDKLAKDLSEPLLRLVRIKTKKARYDRNHFISIYRK